MKKSLVLGVALLASASALAGFHRDSAQSKEDALVQKAVGNNILAFYNGGYMKSGDEKKFCKNIHVPEAKLVKPSTTANQLFYITNYKGTVLGVVNNRGQYFAYVGQVKPFQFKVERLMMTTPKGLLIQFMCPAQQPVAAVQQQPQSGEQAQ